MQAYKLVNITENAQTHLSTLTVNNSSYGVRLSLKGGGCSGFKYDWALVENATHINPDDTVIEYESFVLVVDSLSIPYIGGSTVDFVNNGLLGSELIVQSPKASGSCGCGESVFFA